MNKIKFFLEIFQKISFIKKFIKLMTKINKSINYFP